MTMALPVASWNFVCVHLAGWLTNRLCLILCLCHMTRRTAPGHQSHRRRGCGGCTTKRPRLTNITKYK
ncbi:hypothetical protein Plhal304r1_c015g0054691 [Plasmopara halstedii]